MNVKRRSFLKTSTMLGLVPILPSGYGKLAETTKPSRIAKGQKIGLITPAGALSRSAFERTLQNIDALGLEAVYNDNVLTRSGFLAGTDQQRISDIHSMFENPEIKAIMCARGGYGTTRLLDQIDFEIVKKNPKPFIGYSDITALHLAFYNKTGMVSFHGPVGASEFNDFTLDYFNDICIKGKKVKIRADEPNIIQGGVAEGPLIGGNLTLLTSLLGTPHDPDYKDHILFIEDVGESSYRIDRMLTQLRSAGKLKGVKGIALGYFTDCDTTSEDPYYEFSIGLNEIFKDRLADMDIPIIGGFPFGHEPHNATIPIGVRVELNSQKGYIKMLESAVS